MAEPWVTIVGVGEDGPAGLGAQSQAALDAADVILGPPRHLDLIPAGRAERIAWPVPFAAGLDLLEGLRGRQVVVLASGDPFWFGAGSVLARHLPRAEWTALPGLSCFALAAAEMGWPLEDTVCLGLHAAPLARMRAHLAPGARLIVTLRDGAAVADLGAWLTDLGWGDSALTILERMGGPHQRVSQVTAAQARGDHAHPVVAAVAVAGGGPSLSAACGQADAVFDHDGQITKRPVRAMTLSALAPRPGEHLWDIGAGSGSVALEWLLAHPRTRATCIEARADRAARIARNAEALGLSHRLTIREGTAPDALEGCAPPQAVFIGGGLSPALLAAVLAHGARVVANAVTLEGEGLLADAAAAHGGALTRIEISTAAPLGAKRGWRAAYPIVQWSLER